MRRNPWTLAAAIAFTVAAGFGIGVGSAEAVPTPLAGATAPAVRLAPAVQETPTLVEVKPFGESTQAWACSPGDFCVWEDTGGNGRRCNWSDADPDWQAGLIRCSWSSSTPVESALDNGNVAAFLAVQVFRSANYQNSFACLRRGTTYNITAGGIILRSHKWVTFTC